MAKIVTRNADLERKLTDQSLETEREKADTALADTIAKVAEDADRVVEQARENADILLEAAREKADKKREGFTSQTAEKKNLSSERKLEDSLLEQERAVADEILEYERKKKATTMKRLLPLERERTDRKLLTERDRLDSALAHRDDFLSMVCHDLRDLLNGIVVNAELLAAQSGQRGENNTLQTGLQIQRYGARMNRLIGDLVDVTSIDAGKFSVVTLPSDTRELVKESIETFQTSAQTKGITLKERGDYESYVAELDPERVLQVLANFISNAIKFTPQGGIITISRELGEDFLTINVVDTGPGIPPNMHKSIFERFWQIGENDRRGLGLGLYISKCIVESHGGKIGVESKAGEGSKFFFSLPVTIQRSPIV